VLLGILLLHKYQSIDSFTILDHFFEEFYSYGVSRVEITTTVENLNHEVNSVTIKGIKINISQLGDDMSAVIITPETEPLALEIEENIHNHLRKVALGDNVEIGKLLNSKSSKEFHP